jgi:hypothetical protein
LGGQLGSAPSHELFGGHEDDRGEQKLEGRLRGVLELPVEEAAQGEAGDPRRDRSDEQKEGEALGRRFATDHALHQVQQLSPEVDEEGPQGSYVQKDVEGQAR